MKAEIDQSGKIEDLNTHTVVSLANHVSGSVYITVSEKIKLVKYLRSTMVNRADLVVMMFSTVVFILIIKFGKKLSTIEIDEEYTGREKYIRELLNKLFVRNKTKNIPEIRFKQIGKKSSAHKLCWIIHRRKLREKALTVGYKEILKYWF